MTAIYAYNGNIGSIEAMHTLQKCAVATVAHHNGIFGLLTYDTVVDKFRRNRTRGELFDILGKLSIYGVIEAVTLYGSEDCFDILGAWRDTFREKSIIFIFRFSEIY